MQKMDGSGDNHIKWDKPSSKSQMPHTSAHLSSLDPKW
jgi:hypothetical protein